MWDLSDPYGKGYLDHNGFFIALKLVALAQNGLEVNMANVAVETPPPNMVNLLMPTTLWHIINSQGFYRESNHQ